MELLLPFTPPLPQVQAEGLLTHPPVSVLALSPVPLCGQGLQAGGSSETDL